MSSARATELATVLLFEDASWSSLRVLDPLGREPRVCNTRCGAELSAAGTEAIAGMLWALWESYWDPFWDSGDTPKDE